MHIATITIVSISFRRSLPKRCLLIVARIAAGAAHMPLAAGARLARLACRKWWFRFACHAGGRRFR